MTRIAVMGGSFDPIHLGHLVAASEVCYRMDLDRVVFSPTGHAWRKPRPHVAPAQLRYAMTAAAVAGDPRFDVTSVDIDRDGPTYTVDTLTDLRAEWEQAHPGDSVEWFFITGADALADLPHWREPERILELAHLIGVTRPGTTLDGSDLPSGAVTLVEIPALAISSTEVRDRVAAGAPIRYLVSDSVEALIAEHGLYSASAD